MINFIYCMRSEENVNFEGLKGGDNFVLESFIIKSVFFYFGRARISLLKNRTVLPKLILIFSKNKKKKRCLKKGLN